MPVEPPKASTGQADAADDAEPTDAPGPLAVDDQARFVQLDLERYLATYPNELTEKHKPLFETCRGAQCLQHGVSESVRPWHGAGSRYLVPLWLKGCMTGSAKACILAGQSYQNSRYSGAPEVPTHEGLDHATLDAKFRQYVALACAWDDKECFLWADFTLGDTASTKAEVDRAIERLRDDCGRGLSASCGALARHSEVFPIIGNARELWKQACEKTDKTVGRECARYAALLLATGNKTDRQTAIDVLGPTCDPTTKAWADACTGDPAVGLEGCEFVTLTPQIIACSSVAAVLPPAEALRVSAALCVGGFATDDNIAALRACRLAATLADQLGRSGAFQENIRIRTCKTQEMDCWQRSMDLSGCADAREQCVAAPPP